MWFLQRLWIAITAQHCVVLAVIGRLFLCPHRANYLDTLTQHRNTNFWLWKVIAVSATLIFVPTSTDAPVKSATRNHIKSGRYFRQQTWFAIQVATNHLSEPNRGCELTNCRHHSPTFKNCFVCRARNVVEMVVDPNRIKAEFLSQLSDLNRLFPFVNWFRNRN